MSRHPIGANTWIWTSPLTDERLAELAPRIRAWGFSTIELPIENLGDWAPVRTAELLSRLGLAARTRPGDGQSYGRHRDPGIPERLSGHGGGDRRRRRGGASLRPCRSDLAH